ncbi:ABC transporter permease [Paenibacillus gorillae]|uniref:ABC transporter permease n=1 Tax=Paenibacillus gorillae TaxID=1243662 RepID=UPI0004AF369F|nr:ABC transporter permease [Paenibacillus gorillae]
MRIWWTTVYYEIIKYSKMRSMLLLLTGLPLVLIFLLGNAFNQELKPAKVAVYISDQGELRSGIESFWKDPSIQTYMETLSAASETEVKDLVREGTADYGVVVPADYSSRILMGQSAEWKAYPGRYEERNIAARAVIDSYMSNTNLKLAAMETLGAAYSSSPAASSSDETARPGEAVFRVGNVSGGKEDVFKSVSAVQYYAAAYLIMFLLYGGMSATLSLMNQRSRGTLQRIYAVPGAFRKAVAGILTGALALAGLQAIVIIGFSAVVYDVDWGGRVGWIALTCLLTAIAGTGLAVTLGSLVGSTKSLQTLFGIVVFVMTFLSGGMVPNIEQMVGGAGKYTLNYWANEVLRTIMYENDPSKIWSGIGILAAIAFCLALIGAVRLPKVVKKHA